MKKMKVITDKEFADFLTEKPLYTKIIAVSNYEKATDTYSVPNDFVGKPFKFICPNEKNSQTFRTNMNDGFINIPHSITNIVEKNKLPNFFDRESGFLMFTIQLVGVCQSCGENIDFLIKVESDKSWFERKEGENGLSIYLRKIGQFPPYSINPDKVVDKYLTDEDSENYRKALINLSVSYGIGAFAYFRRIIENEIKRIIKDISEMDFEGVELIKQGFLKYQNDHQMSNLIDILNKHLPKSLTELDDNPIKLLYEQLSGGIHSFSEEECLEKAKTIDIILSYVIKKVNEEKYQIRNVKEAMKKLRNGC